MIKPLIYNGIEITPVRYMKRGEAVIKTPPISSGGEFEILGEKITIPESVKEEFLMNPYDVGLLSLSIDGYYKYVFSLIGVTDDALDACFDHIMSDIQKTIIKK